ncbi:MAG: PAS domain-containing protein [Alphaproteobacteria bacterium]|nr:PAS domain-containing protein [Alphaproteobacteria bacterium]
MTKDFVTDLLDIGQLQEPHLKFIYTLWEEKSRQLGHLPAWHDFKLDEIVENMPQMSMVEYVAPEDRFRVRFSGSEYDDLVGRDITGTYFDELPDAPSLEARARRVTEKGTPIMMEGLPLKWAEQEQKHFHAFSLPLKSDPLGPVDQLLYMMVLD